MQPTSGRFHKNSKSKIIAPNIHIIFNQRQKTITQHLKINYCLSNMRATTAFTTDINTHTKNKNNKLDHPIFHRCLSTDFSEKMYKFAPT